MEGRGVFTHLYQIPPLYTFTYIKCSHRFSIMYIRAHPDLFVSIQIPLYMHIHVHVHANSMPVGSGSEYINQGSNPVMLVLWPWIWQFSSLCLHLLSLNYAAHTYPVWYLRAESEAQNFYGHMVLRSVQNLLICFNLCFPHC